MLLPFGADNDLANSRRAELLALQAGLLLYPRAVHLRAAHPERAGCVAAPVGGRAASLPSARGLGYHDV